jgi:predicted nucleic acid-binding protein
VILVDSSAWIASLRRLPLVELADHVAPDEIATCLPVIQEVLQGIRDEEGFAEIREALYEFPRVEDPITSSLVDEAVALYRAARRRGYTLRSSLDCLIAACALRHDLEILHRDRDYDVIAKVSALRVRRASSARSPRAACRCRAPPGGSTRRRR